MDTNNGEARRRAADESWEDDGDIHQMKRVKQEPQEPEPEDDLNDTLYGEESQERVDNGDNERGLLGDEPMEDDDDFEQLPKNEEELWLRVFLLNPDSRQSYVDSMRLSSLLKNVNNRHHFATMENYLAIYIPTLMHQIASHIERSLRRDASILAQPSQHFRDYFILLKDASDNDIDFKSVSLRLPRETSVPQSGDFVVIKTKYQRETEDEVGTFSNSSYFGIVLTSSTRTPDSNYRIEVSLLERLPAEERRNFIADEVVVRVRFARDLCLRNDFHLALHKLDNFRCYTLQARSLYKFDENPLKEDLLKPKKLILTSGVPADEDLKLDNDLLDTIQKSIDLVWQNNSSSSNILCIESSSNTIRHDLKLAIITQIKRKEHDLNLNLTPEVNTPILVIAKNATSHRELYDQLITNDNLKDCVFFDGSVEEKDRIDRDLIAIYQDHIKPENLDPTPDTRRLTVERYTQCIYYLRGERSLDGLDPKWIVEMLKTRREMKKSLLSKSAVILATLDDLYQDITYLSLFNPKNFEKNKILCCIVDDAQLFKELETLSLSNFGVSKMILMSSSAEELRENDELSVKRLTRSLFTRYSEIDSLTSDQQNNSSFVRLPG